MTRPLHTYDFEISNDDLKKRHRRIESLFGEDEIAEFALEGYSYVPGLLDQQSVETYRLAVDQIRNDKYGKSLESTYSSESFAGQYLREPHLYDRRLWPLLDRRPIVDTVRSLLGPRIVMRSFSARITFGGTQAGTKWHRDQRSLVRPTPALFTEPHVVTCLIYLDDIDEACGPTFVMPRTHRGYDAPPPSSKFVSLPGERAVSPQAGSVLFLHSALWHRGGLNGAAGRMRRLLIQQFAPAWARKSEFEPPADANLYSELVTAAREVGDEERLELLGEGGYM
ncbi:MAG: phytanoyl-CoA dioxygenase family protein [Pseudomonadota bacterium]